ncbi:collectrin [Denticeps clupeoides]|uniref:Collectrin-like domain-containing protein n=1 Tax=Denticeps clupeoides TaxID=299321 RepID=A0AAY4CBH2_9TELE|nr:collectrin [Denticeps clupeoides]
MLLALLFIACLPPALSVPTCGKDHNDGYQVRLSIKTALGSDAYAWNPSEMFLFRATLAFAMRKVLQAQPFEVSNIVVCNETQRVSFWFIVTSPDDNTTLIPKATVERAVRESRKRINSAFLLSDKTLEFVGIHPTLATPIQPATPTWLIVFGVVMGAVCAGIVALLLSSFVQKRRRDRRKGQGDKDSGRGVTCDGLEGRDGVYNLSFSDDDRLTKL